jgi:hypothetical protein
MGEKVLFEFRIEETDDGYSYVFNHDKETFGDSGPFFMKRFFSPLKMGPSRRFRKFHKIARRRMRRRLDFFERVYGELYGPEDIDEE